MPEVTEVDLPDGRSLHFNYNLYGEVAEVILPTGAKLQYDYTGGMSGLPSGNTLSIESNAQINNVSNIDRWVTERRTYPDGSNLEATWTYTFGPQTVNGSSYACTEVKAYAGTPSPSTLVLDQRHFFLPASRYLYQDEYSVTGTGYSLWSTGLEWRSETLDSNRNPINATERDWAQRSAPLFVGGEQIANDNRVNDTRRYLENGSFAKTDMFYDNTNYPRANNVSETDEYDFDQALKRRSTTSYMTGSYQTDTSIHLLSLPLTQTVYDGNLSQMAQTSNEYDVYSHDGNHEYIQDYGSVIGHDGNYGSGFTSRGNLTSVRHWLNTTNTTIYSYLRYDTLGNPVGSKDANGNLTTLGYTDDFGDGGNPGGGAMGTYGATYAFPSLLTSPPPQPGQSQQTARSQYDFSTGLLTGFKDRNGIVTQTIYNDPFDRPTLVKSALGISRVESHASMYYAPSTPFGIALTNNDVLTARDQTNLDDAMLRSWTHTDGFGRTVQSWTRDPQGDDEVIMSYDALGRVKQVSNPVRQAGSIDYTTTNYDLAGRVVSVTTPDNAAVSTYYSGNQVLVKDQAGKERMSQTNALGQLKDVWEIISADQWTEGVSFPGHGEVSTAYHTLYEYDALDDLTKVTQGAQPARTFNYDSLKRLTSATNPESGTICYGTVVSGQCQTDGHDANGNLRYKTDARGTRITYEYDTLNRVKTRSYNDGTPAVNYTYDSQSLPSGAPPNFTPSFSTGRLTAVTYSSSSAGDYYSYDAAGRVNTKIQQTGGINYPINSIIYDRAGALTAETYPSGHAVNYAYDSAGRTNSFSGNLGGNQRTYSNETLYSPLGGMSKEKFGTDTLIYNKLFYNVRGQLAEIREGVTYAGPSDSGWERGAIINHYSDSCWGMCGGSNSTTTMTDNNGNLKKQDIYVRNVDGGSALRTQYYSYDSLNRLKQVNEDTGVTSYNWQQAYNYDRWANRKIDQGNTTDGIPKPNFGVDYTTNRLTAPSGTSMSYDAAGNLTYDSSNGSQGDRAYDAENRMIAARGNFNAAWQYYVYDGEGQRVRRNLSDGETWQVYGIGGELIAEYAATNTSPSAPQKEIRLSQRTAADYGDDDGGRLGASAFLHAS